MSATDTNINTPCGWWRGHNFGKWHITNDGFLTKDGKTVGAMIVQRRECVDCGYTELDSKTRTLYD